MIEMSYYYALIHMNNHGEFSIEKIGSKDAGKSLSMISLNGIELRPGIYIMNKVDLDNVDGIIPAIPRFLIMEEKDFDLHIFGERVYEAGSFLDDEMDQSWEVTFLDYCNYIIDTIQGEDEADSIFQKRMKILYPEYLDGETATSDILKGKITFQDIALKLSTPILPDPSRSILVPSFASSCMAINGEIRLTDINSFELELCDTYVTISSEEDIKKWKNCFKDFFTIVMEYGAPKLVFDVSKGIPAGERYIGSGRFEKYVEYTYINKDGRQRRFTAKIVD